MTIWMDVNQMGQFLRRRRLRRLPTYHAIILANNDIGRINLYRLVSMVASDSITTGDREYLKVSLQKYREGLLLGSACEAGELYRAFVGGRPEQEIVRLVKFYDYLEIQPIGNNEFMIRR